MKSIWAGAVAVAVSLAAGSIRAQESGVVSFGKFAVPEEGTFVEVNVGSNLINMAARLAEQSEPEVAKLLRGLRAVRVNVIGLNDKNRAEIRERIAAVRSELDQNGWESVVTVREKDQDVGVFLQARGDEAIEGVVVTVIDGGKEAVFVNVVGDIRPEQIAKVGEAFNIEPLKKLGAKLEQD